MSTNLTKREIVLEIYEKTGFPQKEVVATVQMTLDIVMKALAEGRNVELRNFGYPIEFYTQNRANYIGNKHSGIHRRLLGRSDYKTHFRRSNL